MKRYSKLALLAATAVLAACAGKNQSPLLPERGVKGYEREYFLKQESYGIDQELKQKFASGEISEGMTQEMVRLLWGPPDREFDDLEGKEGQIVWEFVTREGNIISSVTFGKEMVRSRAIGPEKIVTEISGDRRGGWPEGQPLPE